MKTITDNERMAAPRLSMKGPVGVTVEDLQRIKATLLENALQGNLRAAQELIRWMRTPYFAPPSPSPSIAPIAAADLADATGNAPSNRAEKANRTEKLTGPDRRGRCGGARRIAWGTKTGYNTDLPRATAQPTVRATENPWVAESISQLNAHELAGHRLGDFYLEKALGTGGMGTVYRAHAVDKPTDKTAVAVKVLDRAEMRDPEARERFHREIQAALKIKHPHIVRVLQVGEAEGFSFLVLEYVHGPNLFQYVRRQGPMPEGLATEIFANLLDALAAIHSAGFIHRDIKPDNILIGPHGIAKLTDFGLVRQLGQSGLTVTGTLLGTPLYMAPEQFNSSQVDIRADLYGMGCVMYHCVTGRVPFEGEFTSLAYQHLSVEPVAPRELVPTLSPTFEAVILKLMRKKPVFRFPDAMTAKRALLGEIPIDDDTESDNGKGDAKTAFTPRTKPRSRPATLPPRSPQSRRPGGRPSSAASGGTGDRVMASGVGTLGSSGAKRAPSRLATAAELPAETAPRVGMTMPAWLIAALLGTALIAVALVVVGLSFGTPSTPRTTPRPNAAAAQPSENAPANLPANRSVDPSRRDAFSARFAEWAVLVETLVATTSGSDATAENDAPGILAKGLALRDSCPTPQWLDEFTAAHRWPTALAADAAGSPRFAYILDRIAKRIFDNTNPTTAARLMELARDADLHALDTYCRDLPDVPAVVKRPEFRAFLELQALIEQWLETSDRLRGLTVEAMRATTKETAQRITDRLDEFHNDHGQFSNIREMVEARRHLYSLIFAGQPVTLDGLRIEGRRVLPPYDYVIKNSITVEPGATLEIMAGARLHFEPRSALRSIRGEVYIYGRRDAEVLLTATTPDVGWAGVLLENSVGNVTHTRIMHGCGFLMPDVTQTNSAGRFLVAGGNMGVLDSRVELRFCMFSQGRVAVRPEHADPAATVAVGGGMFGFNSQISMADCVFSNNYSESIGGGLALYGGTATLTRCDFRGNTAGRNGGGIGAIQTTLTIQAGHFVANQAGNLGGAVMFGDIPSGRVVDARFERNAAGSAGGAAVIENRLVQFRNCQFSYNTAGNSQARHFALSFPDDLLDAAQRFADEFPTRNTLTD